MYNEKIKELARKYFEGTATEQEKQQLHRWYDEWQEDEEFIITGTDNPEDIKNRIFQRLVKRINETPSIKPIKRRRSYRMAAAASILLMLGFGTWFYFKTNSPRATTSDAAFKNDVAPGGNKATLTLADGTIVTLDSVPDGMLARQGNTTITKLNSGQLSYHTAYEKPLESLMNTIATPRGGQYQVLLPDGTKAWLNAASSLRFPAAFTGHDRKVELTGEGYFEVAKNTAMPFIVQVGQMKLEVLGTHFNVMAYGDEQAIATTLLEGAVRISNSKSVRRLNPGQQALVQGENEIAIAADASIHETVAWKNGKFSFNETSMPAIMRQLSRWYDIEVEYKGEISDVFVATLSRDEPISKILRLLESAGGVHFAIDGKKVTVSPSN